MDVVCKEQSDRIITIYNKLPLILVSNLVMGSLTNANSLAPNLGAGPSINSKLVLLNLKWM
jgi:hypothetical protein